MFVDRIPSDDTFTDDFEFGLRQRRLSRRTPLKQVASLLLAISANNQYEGRDPTIIPESLTAGFVAELLGLSVDKLAAQLATMANNGIVAWDGEGVLKIADFTALKRIASL
jgi:CRP/FNR family transcriptional regulator